MFWGKVKKNVNLVDVAYLSICCTRHLCLTVRENERFGNVETMIDEGICKILKLALEFTRLGLRNLEQELMFLLFRPTSRYPMPSLVGNPFTT
jgi:hypothetical protein